MDENCRGRITSEDYADLFIRYDGNMQTIENYSTECIQIINDTYAVIHIPVGNVEEDVIQEKGYLTLPSCFGLLESSSLEASGILRIQNIPNFGLRGKGVIVGLIGSGIDYTNPVFKNADNTTRIIEIWDQTIESAVVDDDFPYGTIYTEEQINQALSNDNPLSIVPSMDENGHGTTLAGIAAGSRDEINNFVGVVPDSRIIVVKLKPAKRALKRFFLIPEEALAYQETDVMLGLKYLTSTAKQLKEPISICVGIGTSQGAHDSGGILSSYIGILSNITGTSITIAGGNEGNRGRHYFGEIDNVIGYDTFELKVGEEENGFSMELWGESPNTFSFDILSPTGEYVPRIPARLGERREVSFLFEKTKIIIDFQLIESQTGDQLILIRFINRSSGLWKFRVYGRGNVKMSYHVWLPIEGFISNNTFFLKPNPYTTITSPGNSTNPITVTAYNHINQSLYINSSRGYTRTGIIKPTLVAPGVDIYGPGLNGTYVIVSGSSASAAQTAGIAAMLLEWGIVRGNFISMNTVEIKNFLIRGARRDSRNVYPNREWGYGIIDIYNVFESLREES